MHPPMYLYCKHLLYCNHTGRLLKQNIEIISCAPQLPYLTSSGPCLLITYTNYACYHKLSDQQDNSIAATPSPLSLSIMLCNLISGKTGLRNIILLLETL